MKRIISLILFCMVFFSYIQINLASSENIPEEYQLEIYKGRVLKIVDTIVEEFSVAGITSTTQIAEVRILNKDYKGEIVEVRSTSIGNPAYDIILEEGTLISIHLEKSADGESTFYVIGYERANYILQIVAIFLLFILIVGGKKGIQSITSLIVIILLIVYMLIPLILNGYNPIAVSILVCIIATLVTLIIIAGWNRKAASAIIGTIGGLIVGGLLAFIYGVLARLTGLDTSEAQMLMYIPQQIEFDYRGLLFAGVIIGALGAVMDVSISISSALTELWEKDPNMSWKQILKHGMNIGRDIMGTMTNTLILAYTGTALSMMLVFIAYNKSLNEIINLDSVASEIIRAVAGSVGLVVAVPITSIAFAIITMKNKKKSIWDTEL